MNGRTSIIIGGLVALAVALAGVLALVPATPTRSLVPAITAAAVPIGGTFTLVDSTGATVTDQTYAGGKKLVFFGFTHCPSICPTELLKIADVMNGLGTDAHKITPLFITIDPTRDTPALLGPFTKNFDDRIIGLTGTQDQIDATLAAFKAYAARVPQGHDYTMDHSSFIYLTDEANHMITLYHMEDTADIIIKDLRMRL